MPPTPITNRSWPIKSDDNKLSNVVPANDLKSENKLEEKKEWKKLKFYLKLFHRFSLLFTVFIVPQRLKCIFASLPSLLFDCFDFQELRVCCTE